MAILSDIEKLERRWVDNPTGLMFAPLAEAYRKVGNFPRALEILEAGLTQHPDYVPALIVRGRCHLDAADLSEAEAAFEQALARDPVNAIALRGMAEVFERTGRIRLAIDRLALLLEVDRGDSDARVALERLRQIAETSGDVIPTAAAAADVSASESKPEPPEAFDPGAWRAEAWTASPEAPEPDQPLWEEPTETPALAVEPPRDAATEGILNVSGADAESWAEAVETRSDPEHRDERGDSSYSESWSVWAAWTQSPVPAAEELPPATEPPATAEAAVKEESGEMAAPPTPFEAKEPALPTAATEPSPVAFVGSSEPEAILASIEVVVEMAPVAADVTLDVPPGEPAAKAPVEGEAVAQDDVAPEPAPAPAADEWPEDAEAEVAAPTAQESPPAPDEPVEEIEAPASAETAEEPTLIVTESMAELFHRQGHHDLALAVYRQLAQREPGDERLQEAVSRLAAESGSRHEAAAAPVAPAPSWSVRVTGGVPAEHYLRAVLEAPPPAVASSVLPPAIERAHSGEPTRVAAEPLSLSAVFGGEPPPPPIAGAEPGRTVPVERSGGEDEPSYDEFFGTVPGESEPSTSQGPGARPSEAEDLRQFNEWLKGLKR